MKALGFTLAAVCAALIVGCGGGSGGDTGGGGGQSGASGANWSGALAGQRHRRQGQRDGVPAEGRQRRLPQDDRGVQQVAVGGQGDPVGALGIR